MADISISISYWDVKFRWQLYIQKKHWFYWSSVQSNVNVFLFISVCFMRLFTYQTIMYGTSRPRVIPTRMRVSQRRIFPTAPTSSAQTGISYTAFFHSPRALELANWRLPSLPLSIILFYALTVRVFHALFFPAHRAYSFQRSLAHSTNSFTQPSLAHQLAQQSLRQRTQKITRHHSYRDRTFSFRFSLRTCFFTVRLFVRCAEKITNIHLFFCCCSRIKTVKQAHRASSWSSDRTVEWICLCAHSAFAISLSIYVYRYSFACGRVRCLLILARSSYQRRVWMIRIHEITNMMRNNMEYYLLWSTC